MTNKKALEVLKSWLAVAYQNTDGTDESSAELYESLQTVFNLINRQQAKIEALQMDNEQLQIDIINANINLEHQQKEIEQLKTNNTLLRQDINADTAEIRALRRKFDIAKFEAVREFAEKLKSLINQHHYILASIHNSKDFGMFTVGIEQAVDSVVKEMVGDTE